MENTFDEKFPLAKESLTKAIAEVCRAGLAVDELALAHGVDAGTLGARLFPYSQGDILAFLDAANLAALTNMAINRARRFR